MSDDGTKGKFTARIKCDDRECRVACDTQNPAVREILDKAAESDLLRPSDNIDDFELVDEQNGRQIDGDEVDIAENPNLVLRPKKPELPDSEKPEETDKSKPPAPPVPPFQGPYKFQVNGQEMESDQEKLKASEIIRLAQDRGFASSGKPEEFVLQVSGEDKEFKYDETVDLSRDNAFLIIPRKPTPVA
ncbi:MAG: hypothetical protein ISN29_03850 [Gammaproteobacteria bacterium AqS3]|nr:hypothetical protein [Gammaproteobacteria bacterium AqS3]